MMQIERDNWQFGLMINDGQEDDFAISTAGSGLSMQHYEFFLFPGRWQEMAHNMDWNKVINADWDRDETATRSCWHQYQCLLEDTTANVQTTLQTN